MTSLFLISALAQGVSAPAAAAPAPVQAPAPRPVLAADLVGYLAGTWNGTGTFVRSGKPVESTFVFEPIHDREALLVRHVEREPNTFAYTGVISLDGATGKPVFLMASNHKGGARLFRSADWQDGKLVFEADAALQSWFARERITFIRKSEKAFKATYEMSRDNGATWRTGDEQEFVKG